DRGSTGRLLSGLLRRRVPDRGSRGRGQVPAGAARQVVSGAYRRAGVDLEAAGRAVTLIRELAKGATRPEVLEGVGGVAGRCRIGEGRYIAAATDGRSPDAHR